MRERLRELGFAVGRLPSGPRCSITDVPGVRVGHLTLREGDSIRTGVTAILPHPDNLYAEKVLAGFHIINAYGKAAGLTQVAELGTLESPILLTNTLAVGAAWEGGLRHILAHNPEAAIVRDTVNIVVAECFDGWLSDARSLPIRPEHALEAIAAAGRGAHGGAVGAATGTTCFGFKSAIGCSSRVVEGGITIGCLLVPNYGGKRDLHMLVGEEAAAAYDEADAPSAPGDAGGSIVIVIGTDAPLSDRQLRRLAVRSAFGLGRAGSFGSHASGEYVLAFSTAHRLPHHALDTTEMRLLRDDSQAMRQLFEAVGDVTQEAILDSLCSAEAEQGRAGNRADAFPHELVPIALGPRGKEMGGGPA